MVLDDLSDSLRGTLKKIANAVHVDSKLVKEVVRDIQRALLQADVNVKLVLELSKKIEKRALQEKPPAGMSNREHVIHIVYDELVDILGDSRELPIKKQIIMMVGLYGQGKCVHGESNIVLGSGDIIKAEQLYSSYKNNNNKDIIDDGEIIDITKENLFVPSFNPNSLKTENKKVTHLWKLKGKDLLEVSLDAGNDCSVKVTPEHPFFIIRDGNFLKIRADELAPNDFISVPRKYFVESKKYDMIDDLKKLDLDIFLRPVIVKSYIYSNFDTIKDAITKQKINRNYCKFTINLKKGRIPISFLENDLIIDDFFKIKLFNARKILRFPRFLTEELAEFIGYFVGDGHLTDRTIEIFNADYEIIERLKILAYNLFRIKPCIQKDKRRNVFRILFVSKTLAELFKNIFGFQFGKKGNKLKIPNCLLTSSNAVLSKFIRAYFDCDGSISKHYRVIEITSESEELINQVGLLLRRFGIFSCVSIKQIHSIPYWKLQIESRYAEVYSEKISSLVTEKRLRLTNFPKMGIKQGCGKHDMIPLGRTLRDLRESLGFSIGQIQEFVSSYGIYEKNRRISREALTKLFNFYCEKKHGEMQEILMSVKEERNPYEHYKISKVNAVLYYFTKNNYLKTKYDKLFLTEKGNNLLRTSNSYDKNTTLDFISNLIDSDICWIKIRNIKTLKSPEYVYDLTVQDNHSFIANGIIVHNTTTCGKLATFFKKKGLRPVLIAGDVHRPAAYEQLKQLSEQIKVPFYGDKSEKNAIKVVKEGLNKFKRTSDVIIVDTSGRHKLENDLISEMTEIFKATKPDEKLLVIDAATGQQAGPQAKAFNDAVKITGIVLTKLDGTAKGGGALSASAEVGAPIVFIGTGEHSGDFEKFDPAGFISRLLGMGDIKSLLEKAEESMKGKDAEKTARRIMSGKFTLHDMYDQMDMLSGMGSLRKIAEMLPGGFPGKGKVKQEDMDSTENKLQRFRVIMDSMTDEEMNDPTIVRASRIRRIAKGSGVENRDVKELIKYYNMTKKMMKGFSGNRKMRKNLMKQLQFGK
jgi:signal recognition particle subunit SRP54